jgi:hypothetical protein
MEKFTRRKRKRGIWFHFSFLESPRFSLPTKEKKSIRKFTRKIRKKNELSKKEKKKRNPTNEKILVYIS